MMRAGPLQHAVEAVSPVHRGRSRVVETVVHELIAETDDILKARNECTDVDRLYTREDLAPGEELLFCSTGVTDGRLLKGVRFFGGGHRTSTLFMSLEHRIIRFVDSIRRDDSDAPVLFQ